MHSTQTSQQIGFLLEDLCVRFGFCLPPDEHERLLEAPSTDVDDFTDHVFEAEGMNPADRQHRHLRDQVRGVVARHLAPRNYAS